MKALLFACFAFVVVGCANKPAAHECATGIVCPDPLQCAAAQAVCISNSCGNGVVDPGEVCDDGNIKNGDGCAADCKSAESCGDGVLNTEAGEVCDDGNTVSGDGCSADCKSLEQCGNGITDINEICDDGNTHNGTCGDGHVCDSNADCTVGTCTPDGCSADCKSNETCGNGIKDLGEVCDDGHAPGGCEDDCQHGVGCDNGVLDPGEQCDDGNMINTDDCTYPNCTINVCGDGIVDSTGATHHETCDPGTGGVAIETAGCNIDCTTPSCGDGKVNMHFKPDTVHTEQCDLGTGNNGDDKACTANCQINVCGDGKRNPATEDCDLGLANGTSTADGSCDSQCHVVHCGNGIVDPGEQCDPRTTLTIPADPTETAICDSDCTAVACGDGKTNHAAGEVCDQGIGSNGQPCAYSATPGATCIRCAADCLSVNNTQAAPYCGDGNTDAGHEVCDQGAANGTPCPYATSCSRCNATCSALTTQAGPSCGDGAIQAANNEQCDGTNINGATCASLGYASGTPTCYPSTDPVNGCRFNVTPCVPNCGNSTIETGEQCDTGNLNGASCTTLGYTHGNLACTAGCKFDVTNCSGTCGNNIAEADEQCDGTDLNGATCLSLGYTHGTNPTCVNCKFDVFACSCGDGFCGGGETAINCFTDCHCGNGTCDSASGENHITCPMDCTCGDGACTGSETHANCPADCLCGDGTCGAGETHANCPVDCTCGDGACTGTETHANCPADCTCGDGMCTGTETHGSCPADCTCGDGVCGTGETHGNCPADCTCGDGVCGTGEDHTSCPADCTCGDGICGAGEDHTSCPADCTCGDGTCQASETTASCAVDCPCNNDSTCDPNENHAWCSDCP